MRLLRGPNDPWRKWYEEYHEDLPSIRYQHREEDDDNEEEEDEQESTI